MIRAVSFAAVLLAACSQEAAPPGLAAGSYAGEGRDRLCIAGEGAAQRGGIIAFGAGATNCTASGRLERTDSGLVLVPRGDAECRIPLSVDGNEVRIGEVPSACSYYCGPGATLTGKAFTRQLAVTPVSDLAGDPLC